MEKFLAHISEDGMREQTVSSHSKNAAKHSAKSLRGTGMTACGYFAGFIHDMGKEKEEFFLYLQASARGEDVQRGSVNHSFCAVRFLLERYHSLSPTTNTLSQDLASELLAYAVGAHHGLFDCIDEHRRSGFLHRLEAKEIFYEESVSNFLTYCASEEELDKCFTDAVGEIEALFSRLQSLSERDKSGGELTFYLGLLARLLLSAVVEGDRRDSAEFMQNKKFPSWPENMRPIWKQCLSSVEQKLERLPANTCVHQARRKISQLCRDFGEKPSGIYRLSVPTGSGKTLSSLRFALAHAKKWNKSRIIFTAPLLTILKQNADEIRRYVQDDNLILEHHSNVVHTKQAGDSLDPWELLTQTWDSPIIITTLVQLLNTLFSGSLTCVRRFHSLCNSVIVIDEVQSVPNRMLSMFNLAVNFLSHVCGATVVLCSATQPCLEKLTHPLASQPDEIVPYDPTLWNTFRRTQLVDAGQRKLDEIPFLLHTWLERADSLLLVCNKRAQARHLYQRMQGSVPHCFHLSASMCMAHRKDTLDALGDCLKSNRKAGEKILCVATNIMESGVDISFGGGGRLCAGMDNAVQAAGRGNRNGESPEPVPFYIVDCIDEDLRKLSEIQRAKTASRNLLAEFRKNPDRFQNDLSSDAAISCYYQLLYTEFPLDYQDYPCKSRPTLYSLLSLNSDYATDESPAFGRFLLSQAFKLAGTLFQVFDEESEDVLVPYEAGMDLILELGSCGVPRNSEKVLALLEQAKDYTVSLYPWEKKRLLEQGGLTSLCDGAIWALHAEFYDKETGLCIEGEGNMKYLEV